jgi:hypothetical protein
MAKTGIEMCCGVILRAVKVDAVDESRQPSSVWFWEVITSHGVVWQGMGASSFIGICIGMEELIAIELAGVIEDRQA